MSLYTFALGLKQTLRTGLKVFQFHQSDRAILKAFKNAIYTPTAVLL